MLVAWRGSIAPKPSAIAAAYHKPQTSEGTKRGNCATTSAKAHEPWEYHASTEYMYITRASFLSSIEPSVVEVFARTGTFSQVRLDLVRICHLRRNRYNIFDADGDLATFVTLLF